MTKNNNPDLAESLAASLFLNEQFKDMESSNRENKIMQSTRKEPEYNSLEDYETELRNWIESFPRSSNISVELSISGIARKISNNGSVDLEADRLTPVAFIVQNCDPKILIQDAKFLAEITLEAQKKAIANYLIDNLSKIKDAKQQEELIELLKK